MVSRNVCQNYLRKSAHSASSSSLWTITSKHEVNGVNMNFSDEDRILMENLHVFKGYGANNLVRNFQIKVVDCGN